ncbi:hypothetical protein tinsulaeT_18440 [Thalassotalea insulae]|uniref:SPOR domain-containing protein n=1 Tax=Thalassotalea insulae TaxID=2056778 RepID=A0ABQ6GTN2_9GAMM|nr:SPOR domain-containing protein [Thalassotalea insulae]GLX78504.1 hypothetical protein tinsulaeT_18440 [Thalassotalea insulae]
MKKQLIPAIVMICATQAALASDIHKFGLGVNYHLDQQSTPGYQAAYQWQFSEAFEFDARLLSSNDIEVEQNEVNIFGDYAQFSIGASFLKRYNDELSIKAGTGLGWTFSSSNKQLIRDSAIAPYLMLAVNYQLTERVSLELGQFSHFNSEAIDTNHSIYFNISIQLGRNNVLFSRFNSNNQTAMEQSPAVNNTPAAVNKTANTRVSAKANSTKIQRIPQTSTLMPNYWYVQLGAYHQLSNAELAYSEIQHRAPALKLSIIKNNSYYRIISHSFNSKQRAEDYATMIKSQYQLSGYISQFKK